MEQKENKLVTNQAVRAPSKIYDIVINEVGVSERNISEQEIESILDKLSSAEQEQLIAMCYFGERHLTASEPYLDYPLTLAHAAAVPACKYKEVLLKAATNRLITKLHQASRFAGPAWNSPVE